MQPELTKSMSITRGMVTKHSYLAFFFTGFVFVTNDEQQSDGFIDASVALFRAHNYIKQKSNAAKALSFITDVRV